MARLGREHLPAFLVVAYSATFALLQVRPSAARAAVRSAWRTSSRSSSR